MREYCEELVAAADHMRPNFWPNTPDILPETLQHGGPAMFKIRAVLASMLVAVLGHLRRLRAVRARAPGPAPRSTWTTRSTSCGPATGRRPSRPASRWRRSSTRLNAIRRDNPALHWLRNLRFHDVDNDAMLCWSKRDDRSGNTVLVVCSLDSRNAHWGNTTLDMPALGFDWHERIAGPRRADRGELRLGSAQRGAAGPVRRTGARVHRAPQRNRSVTEPAGPA